MSTTRFEHPISGRYNETVAVLDDGRRMTVDTQYGVVIPHVGYSLDGVDVCLLYTSSEPTRH